MKTNKSRKRLCSALLCLILTVSMLPITGYAGEEKIAINEENFPDDNFRAIVSQKDKDGDGFLSAEEIKSVTILSESGMYTEEDKKIKSLKGIEYFTSLNHLAIIDHNLSSLDVSKLTNLEHLHIEKNPLTEIDVSNNTKLTTLYCQYNQLTKIDVSQNMDLTLLYCHGNQLTWVDITNLKKLNNFLCSENKYPILLGEDNVFNINQLPKGFDVNKASNWQNGSLSGDNTKLTVMDGSKNVTYDYDCGNNKTVNFSLVPTYGITMQTDDHGKVTASIASANVTSAATGKNVTLEAIPDEGYQFKEWQVVPGNITINDNKFTMPANPVTVKAIFEQKKYAVTVQTDGNGTASASVASVKVTSAAKDEQVTLTAAPSDGYEFKAWEIVPGNITINDNQFTMPANPVTVKAIFEQKKYAITVQTEGNGTASVNFTSAAKDEVVTLTAAPSEGYEFKAWEIVPGNITINDNQFTMPANPVTVKAIFEQKKYAITVQTEGNGTASVNFTSAAKDEVVTLTAAPSEGYEFKEWQVISGNITINDNKFTMPASEVTIKASFKKKAASGGSSGGGAYVPSTPAAPSNPKPSGSAITSDVSGSTSRKDGETSTKVDQSTADKLVDAAIDNKSTDIVIDTASKTENGGVPNVKASEVTLPTETIKNIAEKTAASLTIKTDVGEIKLDNKAAASVSKQGENIGAPGEQETISIIAKKVKEDTEEVRYELEIKNSGGKTISDFRGGTATITVPVPSGLQGESLICVYIDKKGHYNKVKGKWTADGRYAFSTGHFSTYAMMREITADTVIAKQKAAVRKMTMEVRTKIVKTKSGKQAIRVTWTSGGKIVPDGVQIYRSTKKGGSFGKKPIFTTEKTRYLNTAVKTGQRYYYKVRGYVTIDGETVYTKLSGKGNRKLPETV